METLIWECCVWTKEAISPLTVGRMLKCDGCSSIVPKAERYSCQAVEAETGEAYKVFANWCPDCVAVAKAGR